MVARRTRRPASDVAPTVTAPPIPRAPAHGWPVWGHDAAVADFRTAIATNRVRHAYLLGGAARSGKRTLAVAFAQALTCLAPPEPGVACGVCRSCAKITRGVHPDVQRVSLESQAAAAERANRQNTSLTIETIREVTSLASLRPMESAWRVTMIDDAETMQGVAQEALLKTLEEPPGYLVLMLLSDDTEALLPTIRSRCQVVDLRPVARATTGALLEATGVDPVAAGTLAGLAGGRPGWAVRAARDGDVVTRQQAAVDRALTWMGASAYDRLVTALRVGDGFSKGREETFADLDTLLGLWRDALLLHAGQPDYVTYRAGVETLDRWLPSWELTQIHHALCSVQTGIADLESNVRPRLALEKMVLQWPTPPSTPAR